jgi:hypothetical protein
LCMPQINMTYIHPIFHQYVCVFLSEWSSINDSNICGNLHQVRNVHNF